MNQRFWQPFVCPTNALDLALQSAGGTLGIVEKQVLSWPLPWMLTLACSISHHGPESNNWPAFPQFHVSFVPSFQTVKRTFEGLPLEIKCLETTGFRAKSNTCSFTQREDLLLPFLPVIPSSPSSMTLISRTCLLAPTCKDPLQTQRELVGVVLI